MSNYRIIALDPGGTTGWATYSAQSLPGGEFYEEKWNCGHLEGQHHKALFEKLEFEHTQEFHVICESFEFRQNKQRDNINLMSKEYIGVVKYFGQERGLPVVFQTAGAAKPFVTDQKIKAMGLWFPGKKHGMDAMRHLLFYMVTKQRRTDLIECWKDL